MVPQPPVRINGNPLVDWIILVVGFVTLLYYLKAIRLARATVRQALRLFVIGFLLGLIYYIVRGRLGGDSVVSDGFLFGFLAFLFLPRPKRSRYIPAKVKREIIARDLTTRGHKYDPRKHHIDHKWAFSRGGGHTPDNLRIVEKERNLRKGAKKPGIWDMFFR